MEEIKIFENEEFGQVRTIVINNEPWFVGKDVATALGYANPKNAVPKHVLDEDKLSTQIEYAGNMNCDYCIDFSGNLIYIELAGILENKKYQNAYRNNTPINSKSKELYRQSLNRKREIFEKNNLNYYILLPDEMNVENYKNIIEYEMSKAA